MTEKRDLIAYCGFYCGDCLGYTGVIADAAERFAGVLRRYRFDRTAECIFPTELSDYGRFSEILEFMTGLRCAGVCRVPADEGGASKCEAKKCCLERGFHGCYECDDFETCDTLRSLSKGLHFDSCAKNMRAIRRMGLESWLASGERFCYWTDSDDPATSNGD